MDFASALASGDRAVQANLGGQVVYSPGTGAPVTVTGIFDAAYVVQQSGDAQVSSSGPAVFLTLADLPTDPDTDTAATVTVNGTQYRPHEVKPDGMGGVVLLLHQV